MNRKGQVFFFTLMLAIVVLVLMFGLLPGIQESVSSARNQTTGMDCDNSSISDFDQATCIITDLTLPYWIMIMLGIVGAMIGAKVVFG